MHAPVLVESHILLHASRVAIFISNSVILRGTPLYILRVSSINTHQGPHKILQEEPTYYLNDLYLELLSFLLPPARTETLTALSSTMEGRANCSQSYSSPDPMSRIAQDLNGHHSDHASQTNGEPHTMLRRTLSHGRKPRVCIVGAGVAGMRCAQILGQKGVDVTVFEARDRTGGRVCISSSMTMIL